MTMEQSAPCTPDATMINTVTNRDSEIVFLIFFPFRTLWDRSWD